MTFACRVLILVLMLIGIQSGAAGQINMTGQFNTWASYNHDSHLHSSFGGRYIPEMTYKKTLEEPSKSIDLEISLNVSANSDIRLFDSTRTIGSFNLYRAWLRYSSKQFELRAGLQKINFGSATILRPLMWFDQIDPRDPIGLTRGVYGVLARYYFLNNANIWVWGLWGNHELKGWELLETKRWLPEFGSRIQLPLKKGEIAVSNHFRKVDPGNPFIDSLVVGPTSEYRLGLDLKLDIVIGMWFESSWTHTRNLSNNLSDQFFATMGIDYTIGIGNGLTFSIENLMTSFDSKPFQFIEPENRTGLALSYPISLYDKLNTIVFYDWKRKNYYSFVNWAHDFKKVTTYLMFYWNNTEGQQILINQENSNYSGKGLRFMLLYYH